jgi:hypothetical protein
MPVLRMSESAIYRQLMLRNDFPFLPRERIEARGIRRRVLRLHPKDFVPSGSALLVPEARDYPKKWDEPVFPDRRETIPMKNSSQHLIAEVPRRQSRIELTIGIDLGDVWSHYCTLNEGGEVVDRGRFRTTPKAIEKWFYRPTSSTGRDGSGNSLDLDQRTA